MLLYSSINLCNVKIVFGSQNSLLELWIGGKQEVFYKKLERGEFFLTGNLFALIARRSERLGWLQVFFISNITISSKQEYLSFSFEPRIQTGQFLYIGYFLLWQNLDWNLTFFCYFVWNVQWKTWASLRCVPKDNTEVSAACF